MIAVTDQAPNTQLIEEWKVGRALRVMPTPGRSRLLWK